MAWLQIGLWPYRVIKLIDGSLSVENGNLTAGNFSVDMKTIQETGNPDAEGAAKLAGHLMAADFFDVEKHATSTFRRHGFNRIGNR
jgi:polyisoprenoid-binding protein YceI